MTAKYSGDEKLSANFATGSVSITMMTEDRSPPKSAASSVQPSALEGWPLRAMA